MLYTVFVTISSHLVDACLYSIYVIFIVIVFLLMFCTFYLGTMAKDWFIHILIEISLKFEKDVSWKKQRDYVCEMSFPKEGSDFVIGLDLSFHDILQHIRTRAPEMTYMKLINILQCPELNRNDVVLTLVTLLEPKTNKLECEDINMLASDVS